MVNKHVNTAGALESCGADPNNPNARGCPFVKEGHTTATEPAAQKKFAEAVNTLRSLEEEGVGEVRTVSKGKGKIKSTTSASVQRLLKADAAQKMRLYSEDRKYVDSDLKPQIHDSMEMYARELNEDIDYDSLSAAQADDLHKRLKADAMYKRQNQVTDAQRRALYALEKESGKDLNIDYSKMNYDKASKLISELNLSEEVQSSRKEKFKNTPKQQHVPEQDRLAEERKQSTAPMSDAQKSQVQAIGQKLGRKIDTENMTAGDYWKMIGKLQEDYAKSQKDQVGKYR